MSYGSGGHNRKRIVAEQCVRIDAAMLHDAGMFGPGKSRANFWPFSVGTRPSCVVFALTGRTPAELWLVIWPGKSWRAVAKLAEAGGINAGMFDNKQRVAVSTTTCNYGKERYWLHCPRCNRRVFRLFYYDNLTVNGERAYRFACRHCWELTYTQRRTRGYWKQQDRVDKIKRKFFKRGAEVVDDSAWRAMLPDRPKGMKMARYMKLADKFDVAAEQLRGAFCIDMQRMIKQFDGK